MKGFVNGEVRPCFSFFFYKKRTSLNLCYNTIERQKEVVNLSQAMMNMWISFFALGLMFLSAGATVFSRQKLKGWLQKIVLAFSFVCIVIAGIIVFFIVFGGPTAEIR